MYILLEGMPGTGKTTIAKGLAEITGAEYVKSVISDSRFGNSIKKVRSKNINTSLELFFLSDLLFDELRVRDLLKNIDDIAFCNLTNKDVVRHPLVQKIVKAYDDYEARTKRR